MRKPKPQEIYRHFKGNLYQIITLAKHSETGEELVIYQALYGEYQVYARPLEMFLSPVDKKKYPQASQEQRFERILFAEATEIGTKSPQGTEVEQAESENETYTYISAENSVPKELMEFLDADSYEKRLEILTALAGKITNETLTTMSVACDIELKDGPVEERYEELKNCLLTLERFECKRLR